MAFNVFLVFFFRTSPDAFRKWWWLYCLICYGGPFGISLALVLVRHPGRGRVFGQAVVSAALAQISARTLTDAPWVDLVLGRPGLGKCSHLLLLHAHLDLHCWITSILLHGWISRLPLQEQTEKLFRIQEQRDWNLRAGT